MSAALLILGAGGHARIAAEAWRSGGGEVAGFYDDQVSDGSALPLLGTISEATGNDAPLHIAIGANAARRRIAQDLPDGRFPPVIHAGALLTSGVAIGPGSLVGAGAVIQVDAHIGRHVIVNSCALIEHDCIIADFVHVAPGVRMAGNVHVGEGALLGIGCVIVPGVAIGAGATVGAGAVVIRDIAPGCTVVGNPAR